MLYQFNLPLPSSNNEFSLASGAVTSSTTTIMEKTLSSLNASYVKEPEKEVLIEKGGKCASVNLTFLGPELTAKNGDISTTQDSKNNESWPSIFFRL